ncbi:MAG: hypothetical protein IPM85_05415 [Chitinophagaceae bacterium]|nr:hypothetical protein [Chitinophagaceae bacterium]
MDRQKATAVGKQEKYVNADKLNIQFPGASVLDIKDPQQILGSIQKNANRLVAVIATAKGNYTVFVQLKQNDFTWWEPLDIVVKDAVEIFASFTQHKNNLQFTVINNTSIMQTGNLVVNPGSHAFVRPLELEPNTIYTQFNIGEEFVIPGTNKISFSGQNFAAHQVVTNWNVINPVNNAQSLDLAKFFNDKVTNIFKNKYLSPRPTVSTLQLPVHGIGDWTHPVKKADINDKGLRALAGSENKITLPQGISFSIPSDTLQSNILFTSQWDNYPKEATVPLTGKASHIYLLMAGSTNPMQSRLVNGAVIVSYTDNTADTLLLKNPQSWWPIEQDYLEDGYAFTIDAAKPIRIHLKTGKITSVLDNSIDAYNGKMIDGGAATVLDMPLNNTKAIKELKLQTIANDVIIGLMGVTLIR